MTKAIPSIQKYMTTNPHSVGTDQTLAKADEMMRTHNIRHLPVLKAGKLIGIITDRDLKFVESFRDVDAHKAKIADFSVSEVFTVGPNAQLDEVCGIMAEKKLGSALVVDNDKLVGIFTWVDALKAMSELLHTRLK